MSGKCSYEIPCEETLTFSVNQVCITCGTGENVEGKVKKLNYTPLIARLLGPIFMVFMMRKAQLDIPLCSECRETENKNKMFGWVFMISWIGLFIYMPFAFENSDTTGFISLSMALIALILSIIFLVKSSVKLHKIESNGNVILKVEKEIAQNLKYGSIS